MNRIKDIDQLLTLLNDEEPGEFFISMGMVRSSKNIMLIDDDKISIYNEIDDTEDVVSIQDLKDGKVDDVTNVGTAIRNGNFYSYSYGYNVGIKETPIWNDTQSTLINIKALDVTIKDVTFQEFVDKIKDIKTDTRYLLIDIEVGNDVSYFYTQSGTKQYRMKLFDYMSDDFVSSGNILPDCLAVTKTFIGKIHDEIARLENGLIVVVDTVLCSLLEDCTELNEIEGK